MAAVNFHRSLHRLDVGPIVLKMLVADWNPVNRVMRASNSVLIGIQLIEQELTQCQFFRTSLLVNILSTTSILRRFWPFKNCLMPPQFLMLCLAVINGSTPLSSDAISYVSHNVRIFCVRCLDIANTCAEMATAVETYLTIYYHGWNCTPTIWKRLWKRGLQTTCNRRSERKISCTWCYQGHLLVKLNHRLISP